MLRAIRPYEVLFDRVFLVEFNISQNSLKEQPHIPKFVDSYGRFEKEKSEMLKKGWTQSPFPPIGITN